MKIALLYSGYLRTWERCLPNHRETFGDFEKDITSFFYTYEHPGECVGLLRFVKNPHSFHDNPFGDHKFNTRKAPENTAFQTLNQWHSNFVGFALVPKGFDIYVRNRCDLQFNSKVDFSKYDCSGMNIYIPQGMDFGGVNDQFAFGNYEVMKIYYSVYLNCYDLWNDGVLFHSETMQMENLKRNGVNIVRIDLPQHDIIR